MRKSFDLKLLIIASRFPFPLEKGDKLRLYHQIRNLHGKVKITLVALSDVELENEHIKELEKYTDKIFIFRLKKQGIVFENLFRIFSTKPFQVLYFYNKKFHDAISQIITNENPDIVYCQLVRTAEYVSDYHGKKVLDYMDAFSFGMGKRIAGSSFWMRWFYKVEQKRLEKYEHDIFPNFNAHTIISEQDRNRILAGKNQDIQIIPNGVDTGFFKPFKAGKKYDICFVGNMGYRPNIDAAEYLCTKILPELNKSMTGLKVLLAGARPHRRVLALQNDFVTVSGWMEDIRYAYVSSKVFVAPIFTGIGQQNKVLEAMSMEMPCICTTMVNLPIGSHHGKEAFVADNVPEFAEHIIRLLQNPEEADVAGTHARQFVIEVYSWEKQMEKLLAVFNQI